MVPRQTKLKPLPAGFDPTPPNVYSAPECAGTRLVGVNDPQVSSGALNLTPGKDERRLERATILRVSVKKPGNRVRHTLIGLGIGAAAGIALGAVADARCTGDCIEGKEPLGKEAGVGFGALIGTIVGVALPSGGWREVYRAPAVR